MSITNGLCCETDSTRTSQEMTMDLHLCEMCSSAVKYSEKTQRQLHGLVDQKASRGLPKKANWVHRRQYLEENSANNTRLQEASKASSVPYHGENRAIIDLSWRSTHAETQSHSSKSRDANTHTRSRNIIARDVRTEIQSILTKTIAITLLKRSLKTNLPTSVMLSI